MEPDRRMVEVQYEHQVRDLWVRAYTAAVTAGSTAYCARIDADSAVQHFRDIFPIVSEFME